MQKKSLKEKMQIAILLFGLLILGIVATLIFLKSTEAPSSKLTYEASAKKMNDNSTSQAVHKAVCSQLDEVYKGVSGFNIAQEEVTFITSKGGAHTYGEIKYESMRALITRLNIQPNDVFYDLGSGSGKFVAYMHLATKISKSAGVELSKTRYQQSVGALEKLKEQELLDDKRQINFIEGDMLEADLSDATVIFMCATCFSDDLMQKLGDKFLTLMPGLRIITLKKLPEHPRLRLAKREYFPTSWSNGSPFHYYELMSKPS